MTHSDPRRTGCLATGALTTPSGRLPEGRPLRLALLPSQALPGVHLSARHLSMCRSQSAAPSSSACTSSADLIGCHRIAPSRCPRHVHFAPASGTHSHARPKPVCFSGRLRPDLGRSSVLPCLPSLSQLSRRRCCRPPLQNMPGGPLSSLESLASLAWIAAKTSQHERGHSLGLAPCHRVLLAGARVVFHVHGPGDCPAREQPLGHGGLCWAACEAMGRGTSPAPRNPPVAPSSSPHRALATQAP